MEWHRVQAAVLIVLIIGWFLLPQYYGITEDVRQPSLEAVDDFHDISWRQPTSHPPDFTTNCSIRTFSHALAEEGFTRNPAARLHFIGNSSMDASWAYRDSLTADLQIHVSLLEHDNYTAVYVHQEYNYITHPIKHLNSQNYDAGVGARERFDNLMDDDTGRFWWHIRDTLAADEDCTISSPS